MQLTDGKNIIFVVILWCNSLAIIMKFIVAGPAYMMTVFFSIFLVVKLLPCTPCEAVVFVGLMAGMTKHMAYVLSVFNHVMHNALSIQEPDNLNYIRSSFLLLFLTEEWPRLRLVWNTRCVEHQIPECPRMSQKSAKGRNELFEASVHASDDSQRHHKFDMIKISTCSSATNWKKSKQ